MKKHRKLVALLVALTFLFSIVAPAMAATPSEAEKAADKLNVLGIIEGYPDGSFGLDRNITRAEFAKIAVVAAGLKDAAEQLVNFPSQFSDVKVGEWYTGWINMAASQGYVKGDPAGTFRPNDNITYAEVITVLVRLLGYNDNLTGPWPTNYLAKAVELGITDGVTINASAPAVRGDVFVMANNTLDCSLVEWSTDRLSWRETGRKLIVKSFKGDLYEGLVTDLNWDSKGNIIVDILDYENARVTSYKVADNVIISGAKDPYGLLGSNVEFIKNEKTSGADNNAVVYMGLIDTDAVSKNKARITGTAPNQVVNIDSKNYDLASGWGYTVFPSGGTYAWSNDTVDKVTVVLNEDGDAQWGFVYDYSGADVIEEIDGNKVFGFGNTRFEYDQKKVQVFIKDGVIADFSALAEGDLIYVYENVKGASLLVVAVSEVKEGTLERANVPSGSTTEEVTISGTKYDALDYIMSNDGGKSFDVSNLDDILGEDVKFMLSPGGAVAVLIADEGAKSGLYGLVEYYAQTARGLEVRILNPDGTKAVYYVDTDYTSDFITELGGAPSFAMDLNAGTPVLPMLVEYTLDSNGKIDEVVLHDTQLQYNEYDGKRIDLGGTWYTVDNDTAFFGHEGTAGSAKLIASDWNTFKKTDTGVNVYVALDRGIVKALYLDDFISSDGNFGVVAGTGRDKDGQFYEIFVNGEKVRYTVSGTVDNSLKGELVNFQLVSNKIRSIGIASQDPTVTGIVYGDVLSASSSRIEVAIAGNPNNTIFYYFDDETMIVDASGSTPKLVSRVGKGDQVEVYVNSKGVVKIVRIY